MTETKESPLEREPAGMDISDVDRRFAAFMRALEQDGRAFTGDIEVGARFLAFAARGFTYRQHVEERHPEQVAHVEELTLRALPPEQHEAWLFGYRWTQATEG